MDDTSIWRSRATTERLAVARVLGAKGMSGALKVETFSDWPERLAVGSEIWLEGEADSRRVTMMESGGRVPVIGIEGVESREQAEALTGRFLETEPQPLPEGTYYWHQLEGLSVFDEAGHLIGPLVEVFRAGENEVYRVSRPEGDLLVPALRQFVRRIDIEAGRMVINRPEVEEVR